MAAGSSSSSMPKTQFADVDYNLDVGEPPQELLDLAREKWGETDETRPAKLNELRQMITDKDEVDPIRTDDAFLLRFLRARAFNIEKSYELLVRYCQFKEDNPELHEDIHPVDYFERGDEDIINVLPYREQNGRRIMIYKLGNWNPSSRPVVDMFSATLMLLELGILEQRAQILGGICIFDLQNISLSHAWQTTPSVASKVIQLMVTCFPLKVQALHIIFESWVFDIMFNMFKPFLNEKMKSKLHFHGSDMESLHQHIDPKYLPKRYGGVRSNTVNYKKWVNGFLKSKYIINEMVQIGYKFDENELSKTFEETDSNEDDTDSNEE